MITKDFARPKLLEDQTYIYYNTNNKGQLPTFRYGPWYTVWL